MINTILMSVFERFQEIGILKSIGAMPWDIFKLIWIETFVLCFFGGLLGTGMAYVLVEDDRGAHTESPPLCADGVLVQLSPGLVLFTMGAVLVVGLLSGIYPSWQAARIRPLEAIRSE